MRRVHGAGFERAEVCTVRRLFARMGLAAFPDARLQVERIAVSGNDTIEVELRLRQMFEVRDRKIDGRRA